MSLLGSIASAIAGPALNSLFGGDSAQKNALKAQGNLANQQAALAQQQADMYKNVGVSAYMTALQGLMSSYGYRAPDKGVAGTSLGQPASSTDFLQPGGTWGYFGDLGRRFGVTADQTTTAMNNLANQNGIPPALMAAAMAQIQRGRETQVNNQMIDASREGPQALLAALNPALSTGPAQSGIASAASIYGNQAQAYGEQNSALNNAFAQIGQFIGNQTASRPATTSPSVITPTPTTYTGGVQNLLGMQHGDAYNYLMNRGDFETAGALLNWANF